MADSDPKEAPRRVELTGPARDFKSFSSLELDRRRNSDEDFNAAVFHEAVALVLGKLQPGLFPVGRDRAATGAISAAATKPVDDK